MKRPGETADGRQKRGAEGAAKTLRQKDQSRTKLWRAPDGAPKGQSAGMRRIFQVINRGTGSVKAGSVPFWFAIRTSNVRIAQEGRLQPAHAIRENRKGGQ